MKLMHLSDLHLGKRMYEFSMIEDQKYILKQILDIAKAEHVDGILLAGDIYDKAVPSAEAVEVFDWFLTCLANAGILVFAVSGNHDSAERIAFGVQLMNRSGIYLSPVYNGTLQKISVTDEYGEVAIYLMPFLRPSMVRHVYPEETIGTYHEAVKTAIQHTEIESGVRNVLVAHQFVTGASRCESEEMTVGGVDNIEISVLDDFDYVALGHLHSPQNLGRETLRYCGTPLKYSFSEAKQKKSVTIMELKEKGNIEIHTVDLKPLHDVRQIRGTYLELSAKTYYEGTDTEDYILAVLTDEDDVIDGMQKLRIIYPNLMRIEYDNRRTRTMQVIEATQEMKKKSELELFEEFFEKQNNQEVSDIQRDLLLELIAEIKGERE